MRGDQPLNAPERDRRESKVTRNATGANQNLADWSSRSSGEKRGQRLSKSGNSVLTRCSYSRIVEG